MLFQRLLKTSLDYALVSTVSDSLENLFGTKEASSTESSPHSWLKAVTSQMEMGQVVSQSTGQHLTMKTLSSLSQRSTYLLWQTLDQTPMVPSSLSRLS